MHVGDDLAPDSPPGGTLDNLIIGPIELKRPVEGVYDDKWVGPRFVLHATAASPLESVVIRGYLPYARVEGVRFSVSANQMSEYRMERGKNHFNWALRCAVAAGDQITLTIEVETPYTSSLEPDGDDDRSLSFVLQQIDFRSLAPSELRVATVNICANPVIIIGSPRSGTSIVAWSLAEHSHLWTSAESDLFAALLGTEYLHNIYARATRSTRQWINVEQIAEFEFRRWMTMGINGLFTSHADGRRWVEQSPSNTTLLHQLVDLLPGARFLHILRDGRRVVHSMIHSGFEEPWVNDFALACETWKTHVTQCLEFAAANPDICLTITNEELSRDPDTGFQKVLQFLSLENEPGPAKFFQSTRLNSSFSVQDQPGAVPWDLWNEDQRHTFNRIAGPLQECLSRNGMFQEVAGAEVSILDCLASSGILDESADPHRSDSDPDTDVVEDSITQFIEVDGPVRSVNAVVGLWSDGWVGPRLKVRLVLDEPADTVRITGNLPHNYGGPVTFVASVAGAIAGFTSATPTSGLVWEFACDLPGGVEIEFEVVTDRSWFPRHSGTSDTRQLSWVLNRLEFLAARSDGKRKSKRRKKTRGKGRYFEER